ncbi:MAG: hypothetical protein U9P72_02985 [Campylobacterota bacterium]|nr:hypothetical protein [Campylobacterota bacterium]
MTMKVGMRDLARNLNILDGYDYVDVEDKKTHEYKGLFISPKYADEFKIFLEDKLSKEKQKKLDRIMKFVGIADGDATDTTEKEMRVAHASKYAGK